MSTTKPPLDPLISSPDRNEYFNAISHLIGAPWERFLKMMFPAGSTSCAFLLPAISHPMGIHFPWIRKAQVSALHAIGAAASMIACLVRTQLKAHSPRTELERTIREAV